jgi:glycosyltransferase involved in cell wall biosynthesis
MIEAFWNGAEKRILTVGSLKPAKEHGLLLRAFARLDPSIGARLMILGEGPLRAELQGLAAALGIADRIVMPGFAVDPWPHYRSADLFVLSSSREGYPTVLLEALAAGLPVVTTDCGSGPREIVGQGKFGTLVPPDDADALAAAIEAALRRPHDPKPGQAWVRQLGEGSVDAYEALLVAADS